MNQNLSLLKAPVFSFLAFSIAIAITGCGQNEPPNPKAPENGAGCNRKFSSGQMEHEKTNQQSRAKDSSNIQLELLPNLKIKLDEEIQTCVPPLSPVFSPCRKSHMDSAYLSYRETTGGLLLLKSDGTAWGFLSIALDGSTVELTSLDDSMKEIFSKSIFELKKDQCP